jgi:hypothetical protein
MPARPDPSLVRLMASEMRPGTTRNKNGLGRGSPCEPVTPQPLRTRRSLLLAALYKALSQDVTIQPLRRQTSSSVNPKSGTSHLGHVRMSSTGIRVSYVQSAAYVLYRVPPRGSTRHAYVSTSLTRTPLYHSQLTRTRP